MFTLSLAVLNMIAAWVVVFLSSKLLGRRIKGFKTRVEIETFYSLNPMKWRVVTWLGAGM